MKKNNGGFSKTMLHVTNQNTHKTQKWFADNHIKLLEWPPQSLDMNPIENAWSYVKRKLKWKYCSSSLDALFQNFAKEWYGIDKHA